jgi:hypothetical protein
MDKGLEVKVRKGILKELGLLPKVANSKELYYSENQGRNFKGILYFVSNHKLLEELVKRFESEYEAKVYHCILDYTYAGTMFTLLYVSNYESEWELDRTDLKDKEPMSYVFNLGELTDFDSVTVNDETIEHFMLYGEFGTVGIEFVNGGLDRTF